MLKNNKNLSRKQGVTLTLFVIIASVIISAGALSSLLITAEEQKYVIYDRAVQSARLRARTCAERALERLKQDVYYTSSSTEVLDDGGSCTISQIPILSTSTANADRSFLVTGIASDTIQRINVTVRTLFPTTTISIWNEW